MWWTGECRGKYGIFPGAYVKEDDNQKGKILPSEKYFFLNLFLWHKNNLVLHIL